MVETDSSGSDEREIIWGINTVREALQQSPERLSDIFIQKGKAGPRIQQIIDEARKHPVRLRFVDASRLGVPRKCSHQGVAARLSAVPLQFLEELLLTLEPPEKISTARILVLDSIQDPRNLGSILRSALGAGFLHVIMTRERSSPLSATVFSASAGAISHLNICRVGNVNNALARIKESGFWVYGAVTPDADKVSSIYKTDFSGKTCLVIGGEEKGIRPLVRQHCDYLVTIPMDSFFDSLNASVAAAVIMFEIKRQSLIKE
ncbi:MAG: 23S rRNA (guanosine(2251)-2'-O)-methyltransferase RlmB [Desulfobulbus propionicus]|nr:MAG: 23S rRNA (guanosine(2251)-2'-O)-methyltransferase RlmB [Desulfobulbus propionicus]